MKNTRIFARVVGQATQALVYEMAVAAREDLAMVLPIPVTPGSGEKAVRFLDLQKYPEFFEDLHQGFPAPVPRSIGAGPFAAAAGAPAPLAVVSVGAYDASFVPTIADFSRLDERFRLPDGVWDKLPGYRNFGFVVFKLKLDRGSFHSHPMAFTFPTARPEHLFFPTLHIHDGEIHETEEFDHTLYCQAGRQSMSLWQESVGLAGNFSKSGQTHGLIRPDHHVYRRILRGNQPNGDIVVKPRAA